MAQESRASQSKKDDLFYFTVVTFKVEGCLFRVLRRQLEEGSVIFRDMFSIPDGEPEGTSDTKPITLEGISADEFRQLLRVVYPPDPERYDLSVPEWVSALKLSTMWEFEAIRELCIDELTAREVDGSERIRIARAYDIPQWVLPALNDLARRPRPLDVEDVKKLGLIWALKVTNVREGLQAGFRCPNRACTGALRPTWDEDTGKSFGWECLHCGSQRPAEETDASDIVLKSVDNGERAPVEYVDFMPTIEKVFGLRD